MLKVFRRYTKVVIWIVVGSFILWGGYSVTALKKEGRFAGEVFGKSVSFQEYNQFARATQLFMPSEKPVDDAELLRDYTWQNIIYAHEATLKGIKVSDDEVRTEIAKILDQQGLKDPTPEQYKAWLARALQISTREFEEGLREFMRIQKLLRSELVKSMPPGELEKLADKKPMDPKAAEEASKKQKMDFLSWTQEVNKRAALKDYLALPKTKTEEPAPEPTPAKK